MTALTEKRPIEIRKGQRDAISSCIFLSRLLLIFCRREIQKHYLFTNLSNKIKLILFCRLVISMHIEINLISTLNNL